MYHNEYTHIVVGAGSSGCVVAGRLVEDPNNNVLLVEAGPDCGPDDVKIPAGVHDSRRVPMKGQSSVFDQNIDWNLTIEFPGGQSMVVPQAKIMGGGSSINGGTALRNTEHDSNEWVRLGNDHWDYASVCQTYDCMENDTVRGTHGPHPIARATPEETGKIQKVFVDGAVHCGFDFVLDLNAKAAEGVGPSPVCRQADRRISAAHTYIDPIRNRPNLTILCGVAADRVIFDQKKATGIVLADKQQITASQEVIICAGAIFSPAILQRSGVGPSKLLDRFDIPMVADLPVGDTLYDHPCIPIVSKPKQGAYKEDDYSLQMQARWSSALNPGATDLQLICFSYLYAEAHDPRVQQRSLAGTATGHVAGIGCNINKATSTGTVYIQSMDPHTAPTVMPNYLTTEKDKNMSREIVRKGYNVMTSPPMQQVLEPPIGLDCRTLSSDQLLDAWIESQLSTTYHFCGSCRMASQDEGGVVDQSGRVYSLERLRVCDACIIPTVPAANTMWTTMMFAERIGRSIRDGIDVGQETC